MASPCREIFLSTAFPAVADHTRCTVAGLTPCALAMLRHDQCVSPGGVECKVASAMTSIFSFGIDGLQPRPRSTKCRRAVCGRTARTVR